MIDITTIELNRLALPIAELQSMNSELRSRNKMMQNILIIGGVIIAILLANSLIKHNHEEIERKVKR
jgi:hypothetical protein